MNLLIYSDSLINIYSHWPKKSYQKLPVNCTQIMKLLIY